MDNRTPFLRIFKNSKPIIGMIHLNGRDSKDIFNTAVREINIYLENDVDAVMIEDYFGRPQDVEAVLKYSMHNLGNSVYGHNLLSDRTLGKSQSFRFAREYSSKFIQFDSVSGHLCPEDDKRFNDAFMRERETCKAVILGGVRFKYQPHLSGRSLEEDLKIGMQRCSAIGVTGSGTGVETDINKIKEFRKTLGDFPLIVCAGLARDNCRPQLEIADGGVVGSYFKDGHVDYGDVCSMHVLEFMSMVRNLREKLPERIL